MKKKLLGLCTVLCLFLALVFSLINAFQCFREMFLVGGEHPQESVYMLRSSTS